MKVKAITHEPRYAAELDKPIELTPTEIVTIKEALSVASDALFEQAGWAGDDETTKELREQAKEFGELYNKLIG